MTVSRVHAVLLRLDDAVFIIDAGSSNGTWRVAHEVKIDALRDGDVLMIGPEVTIRWCGAEEKPHVAWDALRRRNAARSAATGDAQVARRVMSCSS